MPLKVAIVSKDNSLGGGAGRVAANLASCLNEQNNIQADHWYIASGNRLLHAYDRPLHGNRVMQGLYKICKVMSQAMGWADFFTPELLFHLWLRQEQYDLYHFHNIATAFSPLSFRRIASRFPTIWTFHDCTPFTGGCMHPGTAYCREFEKDCGNCPQLQQWPLYTRLDRTKQMLRYKRETKRLASFRAVAPSHWLAQEALRSGCVDNNIQVIANGINTEVFRPKDKQAMRVKLKLPLDAFIVMISSVSLSNPYKGISFAMEAFKRMPEQPFVLALGQLDSKMPTMPFPLHFSGHIQQDDALADCYNAADVVLLPSLAESFGLVAVESLSCATPVIASSIGGLPEIIEHMKQGYLVEPKDIDGLQKALMLIKKRPDLAKKWGESGRQKVIRMFTLSSFTKAHLQLYKSELKKQGANVDAGLFI